MQATRNKPVLLSTQEQLNAYWPQVETLLLTAPITEDFTIDKIYQAAMAAQMFIFVFVKETVDGDEVELVLVVSPTSSDTVPGINIITVAGKNLKQHISDFWEYFKGWCVMNGARAIDAYVPDRLEGFVEKLGLKRETVHVRLRL